MAWRKLEGELLERDILIEVEEALKAEIGTKIKVCIGSDSQVKGDYTAFATAIVFLREGRGGFVFVNKYSSERKFTIKERMIHEVSDSVQFAIKVCPILDNYKTELEVHADINTDPNFKSNVALKEAMGYILGMGYTFKAKPDAFASTYCAGKVVS
jgi:predicted RNase H-related nuclease YkuK (DUF458 family)|tara:strand:+ start:8050 stop:8517 length:468 start_codon:yes stop_codon:yes gene_type:complete